MANELSPKLYDSAQQLFMLWLAMPPSARVPKTQYELAEELGVGASTLHNWKNQPGFSDAVYDLIVEIVKQDRMAEILDAMATKAVNGSVEAARFVFEVVGALRGPGIRANQVNIVNHDEKVVVMTWDGQPPEAYVRDDEEPPVAVQWQLRQPPKSLTEPSESESDDDGPPFSRLTYGKRNRLR